MEKTFKDFVKSDIDVVFMEQKEFGETHVVNGKELPCQLQIVEAGNIDTQTRRSEERHYDAIFRYRRRLFIRRDLIKTPVKTTPITIDNEKFLVDDVTEEMGVFVIKLGRLSNNRGVI